MKPKFVVNLQFCSWLVLFLEIKFTFGTPSIFQKDSTQSRLDIINAFTSCSIRVLNFKWYNIDFEIVKAPMIIIRYFSCFTTDRLFPFELRHAHLALKMKLSV